MKALRADRRSIGGSRIATAAPGAWDATDDARDRLTGATVRTSPTGVPAAFAYTYDASGNITRGPLGAYTYGDPAHVHAATAAGRTHTYTYDANGAVLTRTEGATTYTHGYDVQGRQTSVAVAGGATSTFLYNGDGELVARQVAGRTVARYAAGGLYEQDPTTSTTRKYATFGGRRVAVTTTTATPPPPVTTVQYLHQDHLGSTSLVTTAAGAFAQARFHAPFGAPWYAPTTGAVAPALGTRFGEPWPAAGTPTGRARGHGSPLHRAAQFRGQPGVAVSLPGPLVLAGVPGVLAGIQSTAPGSL